MDLKNLLMHIVNIYFEDAVALVKIRVATHYVTAVGEARRLFITYVAFRCALLLMLAGFALMHVAIFMLLPWSPECKTIALLILGCLYFFVPLLFVLRVCSQKFWMEFTKASSLVDEVTGKK